MFIKSVAFSAIVLSTSVFADAIPATHYAIDYEGRAVKDYNSGHVGFNWPGTHVKTQFTGTNFSVDMIGNGDHFDVLINGKVTEKLITNYGGVTQTFKLFNSSEPTTVTIELVKRTENYEAMTKIIAFDHDGQLEGIWENKPHILFIGDSISAGFGSESDKRDCTWQEIYDTSNARVAFPYQTGEELGTSITQISFSGLGLIRNWNGNQPYHDLTYYADKAGAIFGNKMDFEDKYPDLIVVEVGTNDFSTDPQPHEQWSDIEEVKAAWIDRMVEFVGELKYRYNDANVVLMPRPAYPYDYIIPATVEAIDLLEKQGKSGVYSHVFVSPLEGCGWHPTQTEHADIANKLSQFIRDNNLL
ncbi:lipolytic enzyme [Photobacterium aquae]|uniref:Lipolytic enzyme n=1 Tax=Photobacterium aquae TaxID=1195763 RepID=A0A0J1JPQ4_9GAMM|nr:SGNH/GDSL hydrolase family protein [Photobacterium aquae]KLV04212.1 lipolytic enzyme [Photobacterium aquae]